MAVVHRTGLLLFLLAIGLRFVCADPLRVSLHQSLVCPIKSLTDFLFSSRKDVCSLIGSEFSFSTGVIEGDEATLVKALNIIHKSELDYVALLFYSSWCPFSRALRPNFSILSSIFPSIPHFAIEESGVRPSILSKYGVHGFPSLIVLNSTMRIKYEGSRSLDSLVSFYDEFTGIKASTNGVSIEEAECSGYDSKHPSSPESCPFPWARSPENLLHQETYLALATVFVILRLLHLTSPTLRRCTLSAWRRCTTNVNLSNLWGHPVLYLNQVVQFFNSLKDPCRKHNLQGGAKNAREWASKSLATVSFGDASSSRDASVSGHVR